MERRPLSFRPRLSDTLDAYRVSCDAVQEILAYARYGTIENLARPLTGRIEKVQQSDQVNISRLVLLCIGPHEI